ncbi:MAG: PrsW family intramembrane metalloprotease, partial [Haloarcula sp.]
TLSAPVTAILATVYNVDFLIAFFAFVIVYDTVFGLLLLKKIDAYRQAYNRAHDGRDETTPNPEQTEFDP